MRPSDRRAWISTVGRSRSALYSATKAAVEQLARSWAAELGPSGVRVNAIAPGVTLTDGTAPARHMLEEIVERTPAGRLGTPEDIARAVVFLASDEASFVHGMTLAVDGGALGTRPSSRRSEHEPDSGQLPKRRSMRRLVN